MISHTQTKSVPPMCISSPSPPLPRPPLQGTLHRGQSEGGPGQARGRVRHLPPAPQGLPW